MKILDMTFVKGFIRMADDGFRMGWHERNGGNLSYRIRPEEVEIISKSGMKRLTKNMMPPSKIITKKSLKD